MDFLPNIDSLFSLFWVIVVASLAGLVKGIVGFALPMVMISGLTLVLSPEAALAVLIIPTLATNGWQALRQGIRAAYHSAVNFRIYLLCGLTMLVVSAQLVLILDVRVLFALIGGPVVLFAVMQLLGWRPKLAGRSRMIEAAVGGFAGFIGGLSGVWGPPTAAYLTAINTPKQEQVRAQGAIYGIGAVALAAAHTQTGILGPDTLPLALMLLPFALFGLWVGFKVQDRIDQDIFRRATLFVLLIAGLNLLRRAFIS